MAKSANTRAVPVKRPESEAFVDALGEVDDSIAMLRTLAQAMDNERTATEVVTLEVIIARVTRARDALERVGR